MRDTPSSSGGCPVAILCDEAADLTKMLSCLRAATASNPVDVTRDLRDVFALLGWTVHGSERLVTSDFMSEVFARLRAIAAIAPHRQALSPKGAAFQALLACHRASDLFADPFPHNGPVAEAALRLVADIDRCTASVLDHLATAGGALDRDLLAHFGMAEGEQPSRVVQLALALPKAA